MDCRGQHADLSHLWQVHQVERTMPQGPHLSVEMFAWGLPEVPNPHEVLCRRN